MTVLPLPGMNNPSPNPSQRQAGVPILHREPWAEHHRYLDENWQPGQHVSIIAPTGRGGKSYLITRGLLPLWGDGRVLYIDIKDYDSTLRGFGHKVSHFPSRVERQFRKKPDWYRLHVPSPLGGGPSLNEQRRRIYSALAKAYREKNWLIVADEISFLANDLSLMPALRDIWKRGRSQVTMIAATQAPRWAPGEMYDQPTYLYIGRMQDTAARKRLSEIGGNTDEIKNALGQVRKQEFVFVDNVTDDPRLSLVKVGR